MQASSVFFCHCVQKLGRIFFEILVNDQILTIFLQLSDDDIYEIPEQHNSLSAKNKENRKTRIVKREFIAVSIEIVLT